MVTFMEHDENELKSRIMKELKSVIDPEVGLSIVDMGLIKDVVVKGDKATIKMTLTVPSFMCPLARYLIMQVREATLRVEGIKDAEVIIIEPFQV